MYIDKDYRDLLKLPGNHASLIILGMGPQALFLARTYSKYYKNLYMVGPKNWIGYLSRFCKKIVVGEDEFVESIKMLLLKHGDDIPILVSGGSTLRVYLENKCLHNLNVFPKPHKTIGILNDKVEFYNFLKSNNYNFNRVNYYNFSDDYNFVYPLILKWKTDQKFKSFKIKIIKNKFELELLLGKYNKNKTALFLQDFLDEQRSISFAAFVENGMIKQDLMVELIRRIDSGLGNIVKPYQSESSYVIASECRKLLADLNYSGFIEFDFIQNGRDGKIYLIECNPRPWGWIDYLKYYHIDDKSTMVNLFRDIYQIVFHNPEKFREISMVKLYHYLKHNKAVWDIRDPGPLLGQLLNNFIKND